MTVDQIVAKLSEEKQRATYKAVAGILGVLPRSVMMGRPRNHVNSWVVAATTQGESKRGWPTAYEEGQIDPACLRQAQGQEDNIIDDADELRGFLLA